ncbi:MAG: DUF6788 family protein [bacterium]
MKRSQLTAEERSWRSRLGRLLATRGLVRGTLTVRHRVCGRPNCRCALGEKHASLYLVSSQKGQSRQIYIPREKEAQAREWVANYQRIREFLEQISERYLNLLRRE